MKYILWYIIMWILIYLYINNFEWINDYNIYINNLLVVLFETILILIVFILTRSKVISVSSLAIIEFIIHIFMYWVDIQIRLVALMYWFIFYLLWDKFKTKWLIIWMMFHLLWNIAADLNNAIMIFLWMILLTWLIIKE